MIKRFRNIVLLILLLLAGRMAAQVPVLDSVCSGSVRNYRVDGVAGSTYDWILTPPAGPDITLPSDADTIQIPWNYPAGDYILQVIQHGENGCDADLVNALIKIFDAPEVDAGPDAFVCYGYYYKLLYATADHTSSILWETNGDGYFDDVTDLHTSYHPGANDLLNGFVLLRLTGNGLGDHGTCDPASDIMRLDVVTEIIPLFDSIGPYCQFSIPPPLPGEDNQGITGTWDPPVINTDFLGTYPYLFTPDNPAQCGVETTIYITIQSEIEPQFDSINPLCLYSVPPALPDSSLEGIAGTWEPPVISTDSLGTFTYIFTPSDSTQCGIETSIYVTVVSEMPSIFDPIGPLCQFETPPALPDSSINGISGTWDPPVISTDSAGTFTFYFTADPDACGLDTTMVITVLQQQTPEFDSIPSVLCQWSAPPVLPDTSLNGVYGTWDPAWIDTGTPGTFTFTFTPDPETCGVVISMDISIIPEIAPEFETIGPLCQFADPPVLPDTCLQGVPGTWEPPVISTDEIGTFFYVFTPDSSYECVLEATLTVQVVSERIPTFDSIAPLCQNSVPPLLPAESNEGITGTWDPPAIDTSVPDTLSFVFTPDDGQCAVPDTIYIIITDERYPEFDSIAPLCQYSDPVILPDTSNNDISGAWVPPVVTTDIVGTFTFIFTPDNDQCAVPDTMVVVVTDQIIPFFEQIGPLCQHTPPVILPDTSVNQIGGTWDPAVVNTDIVGTFTFIFTPDSGKCAVPDTMAVTITDERVPEFAQVLPLCQHSPAVTLPDTSINNIAGTWDPPVVNTDVVGTFTFIFTPDSGQCAVPDTMAVVVTDQITPSFEQIQPLCQDDPPVILPGVSLENIPGTWDPPLVNTGVPGTFTFTFTPDDDQCAVPVTMDVEVTQPVVPIFDQIGPLSQNSTAPPLPTASNNTPPITGTWQPAVIDTSIPGTYTYTFTPDPGQCASDTTMNITVLFDYLEAITGSGKHCVGDAALVPLKVDKFTEVATFQLKLGYNADKLECTGYTNIIPELADSILVSADNNLGIITITWIGKAPITLDSITTILDLMFIPKEPGQGQLSWYTGNTESYFEDINGAQIPAEFFTDDVTIYQPPEIFLAPTIHACEGDTITIFGVAFSIAPPISYRWTLPNGQIQTGNPVLEGVTKADAGTYTLYARDTLGCDDQKTIVLIVDENPIALFHDSDTLVVEEGYNLDAGYGMATYLWNTGEITQSIQIDSTGLYIVSMKSRMGCFGIDSVYVIISGEEPYECLFIPNAFTPNHDGLNETYKVYSRCELDYFNLQIWNRWGEKLFETNDINEGWDGKKHGWSVPGDAYVYKVTYLEKGLPMEDRKIKAGVVILLK